MRIVRCSPLPLALLTLLIAVPAVADWPQILGSERNGHTSEALPTAFPDEGPATLWRYDLGEGMAGVAVQANRVIVFHRPGRVERVEALSTRDGSSLWRNDAPTSYRGGILPDSGPRAVPAIDGESQTVVALGAGGLLRAVSLADGAARWSVDLAADYGAPEGYFGFGSSPLLVPVEGRTLAAVNVGGQGAGVVAFDLSTGKEVWRAVDDRASYSSPVLTATGHIVVATRVYVVGLEPKTGRELWRVPFGRRGPTVVGAVPVEAGGQLLLTASYGVGARLLDFSAAKGAGQNPVEVWSADELSSHYPTPIVIGGVIFGIDGREDHGTGQLRALELSSGRVLWTEKRYGMAHLLSDGQGLLAQRLDGTLELIAGDAERFRRLASAKVADGTVRALPAYADGVLYVRTTPSRGGGEVLALKLR